MKVTLIAYTQAASHAMSEVVSEWRVDADADPRSASALSEFAGRACYESWAKPNPATATNMGYIENILDQGHYSVLEHGSVSFYIEDVSRSLTHELVRHRHLSPSQLSQRFVNMSKDTFTPVIPPLYVPYTGDLGVPEAATETQMILDRVWEVAMESYERLVAIHMPNCLAETNGDAHKARKMAREAARCVLPNMTPTSLVLTGNHRSWREFIQKRATPHADAEIRDLATLIRDQLVELEPAIYQDCVT